LQLVQQFKSNFLSLNQ